MNNSKFYNVMGDKCVYVGPSSAQGVHVFERDSDGTLLKCNALALQPWQEPVLEAYVAVVRGVNSKLLFFDESIGFGDTSKEISDEFDRQNDGFYELIKIIKISFDPKNSN